MKEQHFKESNDSMKDDESISSYHGNKISPISDAIMAPRGMMNKELCSFIRYRSTINSTFYIEKYVEEYVGQVQCSIEITHTDFDFDKFNKETEEETLCHYNNDRIEEFIILQKNCVVRIYNYNTYNINKDYNYNMQIFLANSEIKKEKIDFLSKFYKKEETKKSKGSVNIMIKKGTQLDLTPISEPKDVELSNYTEGFQEKHLEIIDELKKDKGILLFHGKPGTGKTSYVKSLPLYAKDKKFIFVPPAFGETLSSPEFLTFMINHKNSVLIIEDAESALRTRKDGRNNAVSNLLNITDGILQELLNIQVICTLNCKIEEIDDAINVQVDY